MLHEERELVLTDIEWDEEFADVMRPHLPEEADAFTESVMSVGKFTDPILVYPEDGRYLVIDGHHRWRWYLNYGPGAGIEAPTVVVMDRLNSRAAAKYWMRVTQNGRRNLPIEDQRFHRGKALSEQVTAMRESETGSVADLVKEFAEDNDISHRTAYREKAYAEAVDLIARVDKPMSENIRAGVVGINYDETLWLSKRRPVDIAKGLENLKADRQVKDNGEVPAAAPNLARERYQAMEKKMSTLVQTLMPAVREHIMEAHRLMYPDGAPSRGGFPMTDLDEWTTNIIGALHSWKPRAPCPDCEFKGCTRCKRLGFLRTRPK